MAEKGVSRAIFPFLFVALALAAGCESKRHGTGGAGVQSRFTAPQTKPSSNPLPESQTEPSPAQEDAAETDAASEPPLNPAATLTQRWKLSAQFDVGPAAPMTAASDGVYLVTRRDELLFARLNAENEFTPVGFGF